MGGSPPSPTIVQSPPPPPATPAPVETQSLQTQTALNEVSGQQQRLNMTLGSQLDQANSEFFTGQNIRQTQATGAEARTTLQTQGEQQRQTLGTQYTGERGLAETQGEQQRQTLGSQYAGERGLTETKGSQERLTQAQSQAYDNYKAQRNNQWAQQAYKA
jgi:hypothetical protein